MQIKTTAELRSMLLEEIENVRSGKSDARKAHAISNLASKILQSAKLDLDMMRFNIANDGAEKSSHKVLQLVNS